MTETCRILSLIGRYLINNKICISNKLLICSMQFTKSACLFEWALDPIPWQLQKTYIHSSSVNGWESRIYFQSDWSDFGETLIIKSILFQKKIPRSILWDLKIKLVCLAHVTKRPYTHWIGIFKSLLNFIPNPFTGYQIFYRILCCGTKIWVSVWMQLFVLIKLYIACTYA